MAADLIVTVKAFMDQYKGEIDDAAAQTEEFSERGSSAMQVLNDNIGTITAATAAAGAALEGFARTQAGTNESLERNAIITGESAESLREMVDSLTDGTNSSADMVAGMDELIRRGLTTREEFEQVLPVMDNFAGATGQTMPEAIDNMNRVLQALGEPLTAAGENVDQMTRFVRETDVPMGTLRRNLSRVPDELREMGFGLEDVAAGIEVMRDRGFSGEEAVREFRRAVEEGEGDLDTFLQTLGLSADEFGEYQQQVGQAEGITQQFADVNAAQITPIQEATQWVQNLFVEYGGLAQQAAIAAPALAAVGPILKGVTVVMSASLGPFGLIVAAIAAVAAIAFVLWQNWDEVVGLVEGAWLSMQARADAIFTAIGQAVDQFVTNVTGFFGALADDVVKLVDDMVRAVIEKFTGMLTGAVDTVKDMASGVTGWFADLKDKVVGNSIVPEMVEDVLFQFGIMRDDSVIISEEMNEGVVGQAESMSDALFGIADTLGIGWLEKIGGIADGTIGQVQRMVDTVTSLLSDLATIWRGITDLFGVGGGIGGAIEGALSIFSGGSGGGALGGLGSLASAGKSLAGLLGLGGGGGVGISGASVTGGVAGAGLGGAGAGAATGISGASVTGGASGAGLGGAGAGAGLAAFAGPAALAAVGYLAFTMGEEENRRERFGALSEGGVSPIGGIDAALAGFDQGEAFVGGPSAGFLSGFGRRAGVGGGRKQGDEFGTVGGFGAGPERILEVIQQAAEEFGRLQEVGEEAFGAIGVSAEDVGRIIGDDNVTASELFGAGLDNLAQLAEQTGDLTVDQFDQIAQAVNNGELRLEALQGQVGFTADEMEVLGEIGVGAHADIGAAAGRAGRDAQAFAAQTNAAMNQVESASLKTSGTLQTSFQTASQTALAGMGALRDGSLGAFGDIDAAARSVTSTVGGIASAVSSAADSARRSFDSVRSSAQGIPKMQHGGIVNSPTLALIGEAGPEAVIPLRDGSVPVQLQGAGRGGGLVVNLTQHITGVLPDDVERQTRRALRQVALEWEAA